MAKTVKGALDDELLPLPILDFSGGLNPEADPGDLPLNSSPDCENVRGRPGRLVGRSGSIVRHDSLPAVADGTFFFYDSNGTRRLAVFSNGNLYDMTSHTLTLVGTGVYTAGKRVCAAVLNDKLYFSDGFTIGGVAPNRYGVTSWDPATSTVAPLLSSGSVGTIETPAAKCLLSYTGQLVLANLKFVDATTAKDQVLWSNVNDPTTIIGTNLFKVGQGQGGEINSLLQMGVSSVGVTPFQAIFVGKSQVGVFLLRGALTVSTLSETLINAPVGVLDGATVQYIPGDEKGGGFIAFLGTDRRVWFTDGITSGELSKPIRSELAQAISDRFSIASTAKFTSVRNDSDFMYVLDIGRDSLGAAVHYCYDWEQKSWWRYKGWPSGYWAQAKDASSQNVLYCVDQSAAKLYQGNAGVTDDGTAITPYWKTPWLHGGDPDILKIWKHVYVAFRTNTSNITITSVANMGEGSTASATLTITSDSTDSAQWDVAAWDGATWATGGAANLSRYKKKARLMVVSSSDPNVYQSLRGFDTQVKISQSTTGHFEVYGFQLLFLARGRKRVA